jgi:hypothetical protein
LHGSRRHLPLHHRSSEQARARGGDRAQHYVCIAALAKAGPHTKCRISRDASGFYSGEARSIGLAELEAALGRTSPEGHEAAPKPAQPGPPRTVEELARRTTQTSSPGAPLENASEAIGRAMKKSWLCITALSRDAKSSAGGRSLSPFAGRPCHRSVLCQPLAGELLSLRDL